MNADAMNADNVNNKVFEEYAYYYNLLYADKDYVREAKYIKEVVDKHLPTCCTTEHCKKGEHILNLGCGSGNHDFELAKLGFKITAVDASKSMIECALSKQKKDAFYLENIRFILSDICKLNLDASCLDASYDVVISLFHVSNYFTTNERLLEFFKQAYRCVKKGGIFIFDSWYGPAVLTQKPEVRMKKVQDEHSVIWRMTTPELKVNQNIVDVNYTLIIKDKLSKQINEIKETHEMRYLFLPEVEIFLEKVGFKLISAKEFFTENDLDINTWNSYFVCVKSY
ncbi:MAG: class I SAM-dependent methyltransferase [Oligoflexia bacterium]|nr:class I SAM-dependent methyltransferase [Oligoflexia bacterium]